MPPAPIARYRNALILAQASWLFALAATAPGCTVHKTLSSGTFGREPKLIHRGAPIPYVLTIDPRLTDLSERGVPEKLGPLLARSLFEVAHGGGLFLEVLEPGTKPAAHETRPVLTLRVVAHAFDIAQSYRYWLYYAPLIALVFQPIPGPGTLFLLLVLAGAPLMSERVVADLELRVYDTHRQTLLATHRVRYRTEEIYSLYDLGKINQGVYYSPERALGHIAHRLMLELMWHRWLYYRRPSDIHPLRTPPAPTIRPP